MRSVSYPLNLYKKREELLKALQELSPQNPISDEKATVLLNEYSSDVMLWSARITVTQFLNSGAAIRIPSVGEPELSVILVLYNRVELTLQCLRALSAELPESAEVILVDNASTDATGSLLQRITGAKILRNGENLHFLRAANQGARVASGKYLLFLNNDTLLLPGSLASALQTIRPSNDIGAVGGKLVYFNGTLQEAGSIAWSDGSCLGYGRGDDPFAAAYMFERDVDYVSGAFLLTSRSEFLTLNGFDEVYDPAYYEDSDYCLRLQERGLRVVYDPSAVVVHHEFASSASREDAIRLQQEHQRIFAKRHASRLLKQQPSIGGQLLVARSCKAYPRRVLIIDDMAPHRVLGSGFPRANTIVNEIHSFGCFVTLFLTNSRFDDWSTIYTDIPRTIEVMLDRGREDLPRFLEERAGYYDAFLVSRPHNMALLQKVRPEHPEWFQGIRILYDAEAVFAMREIGRKRLGGETVTEDQVQTLVREEMSLAGAADAVLCVSEAEMQTFRDHGVKHVHHLGHSLSVNPTEASFEQRSGLLFVGSAHHDESPNADALLWFVQEILPLLRGKIDAKLTTVGLLKAPSIAWLSQPELITAGPVENIREYYNNARVFIAPTRFAAGLPMKVHEAAANGIPIVATSLLARQLGWTHERELMVADTPAEFAAAVERLYTDPKLWNSIRANALEKIAMECSPERFRKALAGILDLGESLKRSEARPAPRGLGDEAGPRAPQAAGRASDVSVNLNEQNAQLKSSLLLAQDTLDLTRKQLQRKDHEIRQYKMRIKSLNDYLNLFLTHPAYHVFKFFKNMVQKAPNVNHEPAPSFGYELFQLMNESGLGNRDTGLGAPNPETRISSSDSRDPRPESRISIITPVYGPPLEIFRETVHSVLQQTNPNWVWRLVDASPHDTIWDYLTQLAQTDPRIQPVRLKRNEGISGNTNLALRNARETFVAMLDHDDTLAPFAIQEVADAIQKHPDVDFLYSDADKLDEQGNRCDPLFKPDWSPELMLSCNLMNQFSVYRRSLLEQVGYLDPAFDGAQDWDLYLRIIERTDRIQHIPKILYHWRKTPNSTAQRTDNKPYVQKAQIAAITNHLKRCGLRDPKVFFDAKHPIHQTHPLCTWSIPRQRRVSIVIPTRDHVDVLRQCLSTLFSKTSYPDFQVILVDTGSTKGETRKLYASYQSESRMKIVEYKEEFNFGKACNTGALAADGELLLFLNNDTEILQKDWIELMAQWFERPGVGIVGPKLLYPDGRIQHAGVMLGLGGMAGHIFIYGNENLGTIFGTDGWYRNVSAVTGACMMISREAFEKAGRFDDGYRLNYSDVDLCLKVRDLGYRIVYTPHVRLIHHEGVSHGKRVPRSDFERASQRLIPWLKKGDPYYNPNLSPIPSMPEFRLNGVASVEELHREFLSRLPHKEFITLEDIPTMQE